MLNPEPPAPSPTWPKLSCKPSTSPSRNISTPSVPAAGANPSATPSTTTTTTSSRPPPPPLPNPSPPPPLRFARICGANRPNLTLHQPKPNHPPKLPGIVIPSAARNLLFLPARHSPLTTRHFLKPRRRTLPCHPQAPHSFN